MSDRSKPSTLAPADAADEKAGLVRGYIDTTTTTSPRDIGSVYGGGELMNIPLDDLVGNRTAVQQLINNHNQQAKDCDVARRRLADRESEVEFLKTSPFVAVLSAICTCLGGVVLAIGVNLVTGAAPPGYATPLVVVGSLLIVISGLANILYPYARKFFNTPGS